MKRIALLSVPFALSLPALTAARQSFPGAVQEVLAYERATCAAYQRNDAVALDSLVADGYALTDSHGAVSTKHDDLEAARTRDVVYTDFRNENMAVTMFGSTAIVRGQTVVRGTTHDGQAVNVRVQFTDTVVRLGGRWKLVAGHVSRVPPT